MEIDQIPMEVYQMVSDHPKIDQCYSIKDDTQAFNCLRKVTQEPASCKPRLVLFTRDGCSGCKQERKRHKADIDAGIIEEINMTSPEGRAIANKIRLDMVPVLVVLDCHDNLIEPIEPSV